MKALCVAALLAGAVLLAVSIVKYYRSLQSLRSEAYGGRLFTRRSYAVCMALMVFFLAGYPATAVFMLLADALGTMHLLVASIFFFGAVFVLVVITVQGQMSRTISGQTDEIIVTLVNAMEAKDRYTRGHSVHVSNLVLLFYAKLPERIRHRVNFTQLTDAAVLHDIGKIGISDTVLNKPGRLTEEEMETIREHPRLGKQILEQTSFNKLGNIIMCHHERVDSNGYYKVPAGQIPLESKIIAIADTFSALYSDRVYRPRMSYDEAMAVLRDEAGTHLDAELVDVFTGISKEEIDRTGKNLF